CQHYYSIPYSV
nr:immunoglobulin light chain junction region [Macaca mulatta]